jgi:hypothetical protein
MMAVLSIPEMHKHLEDLNRFYSERTSEFISVISSHPGKFTPTDTKEFSELIDEIRNDALARISEYFNNKFAVKAELYDSEVEVHQCRSQTILTQESPYRNSWLSLDKDYRTPLLSSRKSRIDVRIYWSPSVKSTHSIC